MAKRHSAPRYLPADIQKQWDAKYDDALKQAKVNVPDDENAQHTAAHKEANKILSVPMPKSAAEIDKLPEWQVKSRATKTIDGEEHRVAITIDGKKYAHPIKK